MRILIAEDDLDISNLYKKALEKNRHQVVLTSNGSDCLTNYLTTLSSMTSKPLYQSKEEANKSKIRSLDNSSAKANNVVNTSTTPYDVVILDYSCKSCSDRVLKEALTCRNDLMSNPKHDSFGLLKII